MTMDGTYAHWMRRLQMFLATAPKPQRTASAAPVRHDVAVPA